MYYSNSDKEFVYNLVADHATAAPAMAPVSAIDGYWTVDNHKYASVMPMIASLEGVNIEDYTIAAFCGDECRGIGSVVDGLVMINVHGNYGDAISFRFIGDDKEMQSATTLSFDEKPLGTFNEPFCISTNGATAVEIITAGEFGLRYENGSFILGGDLSDVKSIEIYDLSGKLIAKSAGDARTLRVGNLDGTVLSIVIRKADSTSIVKVIVK